MNTSGNRRIMDDLPQINIFEERCALLKARISLPKDGSFENGRRVTLSSKCRILRHNTALRRVADDHRKQSAYVLGDSVGGPAPASKRPRESGLRSVARVKTRVSIEISASGGAE